MNFDIRKSVHELQAADFEDHACWEYATDEEGRDDQDECTVRPFPLDELADATHQVFVQAAFFFPNGRIRMGVVTLNAGDDPSGHQPALFEPEGLMPFYEGARQPEQSAVRRDFCDPKNPWQRGSNGNTNGLLRQYFPKGLDLSTYSQEKLDEVARRLNERPRKTLHYQTPAQQFEQCVALTS